MRCLAEFFTHLNVMSVVEKMIVLNYMGIITVFFFTDKSTLLQEIFKGSYHSMDEIIDEFKEKLEDYLPKDFNWEAHIGFIQYAIYA